MANDQPTFNGIEEAIAHVEAEHAEHEKTEDSVAATEEEEQEVLEESQDDETLEEEDDSEESETDEPEEEDDSDEEDSDESEEYLFKVGEGDDEVLVKDAEEAKAGYMRQKDYTQKSQANAELKKELDTEKSELLNLKSQYLEGLALVEAGTSETLSKFIGIDWEQLQKDDPIEFDEKKQELEAAQLAYQQTRQTKAQLEQELTKETIEYQQTVRAQELDALKAHIPEAGTDEFNERVLGFGVQQYNFSNEELAQVLDHRMIRVLNDAQKFYDLQKQVESGTAKVKSVKKSMKQKASKSKSTASARKAKARKQAMSRPGGLSIDEMLSIVGSGRS